MSRNPNSYHNDCWKSFIWISQWDHCEISIDGFQLSFIFLSWPRNIFYITDMGALFYRSNKYLMSWLTCNFYRNGAISGVKQNLWIFQKYSLALWKKFQQFCSFCQIVSLVSHNCINQQMFRNYIITKLGRFTWLEQSHHFYGALLPQWLQVANRVSNWFPHLELYYNGA